jgi:hypothetical protein
MRIEAASPGNAAGEDRATSARNLSGRDAPAALQNKKLENDNATVNSSKDLPPGEVSTAAMAPLPQFPEHDVKVQFDQSMNDGILIYQFLDKQSGSLVMQLPSTQMLSVVHEIQNELREAAPLQTSGTSTGTMEKGEGEHHGN